MLTLKPFDYFEPGTLKEAVKLLYDFGEKAQILAGGIDLIPRMRQGKIKADYVVNIQNIPKLSYMEPDGEKGFRFGAMTSLHDLELSQDIRKSYPILYDAVHQIASVQTKCMGTAVGNLCVATPASDIATALLALGANLNIEGPRRARVVPINKFYLDYLKTSLKKGEMVTGVTLPALAHDSSTAFLNLVRSRADIAKVSVAVYIAMQNGICQETRIALGSVAPTVFRSNQAEAVLKGQKLIPAVIAKAAAAAASETRPINDVRSTAEYRKQMTEVMVKRALEKALEKVEA